jgi:hypothetical protein
MTLTNYESGWIQSGTLPQGQRTYYESLLLATLRKLNIFVQFCLPKTDFRARDTGILTFTEVFDTSPDWSPIPEDTIWLTGAHLDSRQISITLERHGDTLKFGDYTELVNYWNSGDFSGLVRGKLGRNMVDYLDILAMNAHLTLPNVMYSDASITSRFDLTASHLYDPDRGGLARTHLEERDIPGIQSVDDADGQTVLAITSPRVVHDIRTNAAGGTNKWLEVIKYANPSLKMRHEAGAWDGVRYIKSNRLKIRNFGKVSNQTTLSNDTVVGQGAIATLQGFSVGQSTSVRYVTVADSSGFSVGQYVTIHSQSVNDADGSGGYAPARADGGQETRQIVAIDSGGANRLTFDRPLMKPHASGDYVTKGVDLSPVILLGGPAVVYGVGERPTPVFPPKIDDHLMVNRVGWRGFLKFQMFRPEWGEIIWTGISDD